MSSVLDKLSQLSPVKDWTSCRELEVDKQYPIINSYRFKTKYGKRVVCELEETKIFLPVRFDKLANKEIKQMKDGKLVLISRGQVGKTTKIEFGLPEGIPTAAAAVDQRKSQVIVNVFIGKS